jgi:copper chaperone CopZ
MPDVTFEVGDLKGQEDAEKLEQALLRLDPVRVVNVDAEKGWLAVSYEGGASELEAIEASISNAGHEFEPSPGARKIEQ